jgi:hypothetical protein
MSRKNPKSKLKANRGGYATLTDNYAFQEYGLTPSEMAKAAKRIHAEIETARSGGELTRFSGDIKTLKFSNAKKN